MVCVCEKNVYDMRQLAYITKCSCSIFGSRQTSINTNITFTSISKLKLRRQFLQCWTLLEDPPRYCRYSDVDCIYTDCVPPPPIFSLLVKSLRHLHKHLKFPPSLSPLLSSPLIASISPIVRVWIFVRLLETQKLKNG